jgi:predicted transcriptional regulator
MARLEAIVQISQHTKFHWTRKHIEELYAARKAGMTDSDIASHFGITDEEVRRGDRKLVKLAGALKCLETQGRLRPE